MLLSNMSYSTTTTMVPNHSLSGLITPQVSHGSGMSTFIVLITITFSILTITGNVLVLMSYYVDRTIRHPTNYFIASLAVSDMIIGFEGFPIFSTYVLFGNKWMMGWFMCEVWLCIDYTVCLVSILTVLFITIDRYFSVCHAARYRQLLSKRIVHRMVIFSWLVPFCLFGTLIFGWKYFAAPGNQYIPQYKCYAPFMADPIVNLTLYIVYYWAILLAIVMLYSCIHKVAHALEARGIARERQFIALMSTQLHMAQIGYGLLASDNYKKGEARGCTPKIMQNKIVSTTADVNEDPQKRRESNKPQQNLNMLDNTSSTPSKLNDSSHKETTTQIPGDILNKPGFYLATPSCDDKSCSSSVQLHEISFIDDADDDVVIGKLKNTLRIIKSEPPGRYHPIDHQIVQISTSVQPNNLQVSSNNVNARSEFLSVRLINRDLSSNSSETFCSEQLSSGVQYSKNLENFQDKSSIAAEHSSQGSAQPEKFDTRSRHVTLVSNNSESHQTVPLAKIAEADFVEDPFSTYQISTILRDESAATEETSIIVNRSDIEICEEELLTDNNFELDPNTKNLIEFSNQDKTITNESIHDSVDTDAGAESIGSCDDVNDPNNLNSPNQETGSGGTINSGENSIDRSNVLRSHRPSIQTNCSLARQPDQDSLLKPPSELHGSPKPHVQRRCKSARLHNRIVRRQFYVDRESRLVPVHNSSHDRRQSDAITPDKAISVEWEDIPNYKSILPKRSRTANTHRLDTSSRQSTRQSLLRGCDTIVTAPDGRSKSISRTSILASPDLSQPRSGRSAIGAFLGNWIPIMLLQVFFPSSGGRAIRRRVRRHNRRYFETSDRTDSDQMVRLNRSCSSLFLHSLYEVPTAELSQYDVQSTDATEVYTGSRKPTKGSIVSATVSNIWERMRNSSIFTVTPKRSTTSTSYNPASVEARPSEGNGSLANLSPRLRKILHRQKEKESHGQKKHKQPYQHEPPWVKYLKNPKLLWARKRKKLRDERKANRAFKIITLIVGAFALLWSPYYIVASVYGFCPNCVSDTLYNVTYYMCYLNSTINPLCYAAANANFRKVFQRIIFSCDFRRR